MYGNVHTLFLSDEERKKNVDEQPVPRASPRSLQKEDSDSVWNELKYFKTEYEKLRNERYAMYTTRQSYWDCRGSAWSDCDPKSNPLKDNHCAVCLRDVHNITG